ncbi:MAG: aminoglycoside adenylyltransferase domain-containing protein [Anaerolineae bacterium]
MTQYGWPDCPVPTCRQVGTLVSFACERLVGNLVGVYLHGSLAMGCFNPRSSDLDLLVVMRKRLSVEAKRSWALMLLEYSKRPSSFEISLLTLDDLHPWRHPAPFDLHYSEDWRERFLQALADGSWRRWNDVRMVDPDLAAHVTLTRARGACLTGAPVEEVFPVVPPQDYLDAIVGDFEDIAARMGDNPVYGVLNACRVWWYLAKGALSSKAEAGEWARAQLPADEAALVDLALARYRGEAGQFGDEDLTRFAAAMTARIGALRATWSGGAPVEGGSS